MRAFFILFFSAVICSAAFGQLEPVKWSFEAEKVNEKEYDIIFTADIERGWSVYSQFLDGQDGPIATSFNFASTEAIKLVGQAKEAGNKKEIFDKTFGMKLTKFSGKARFTQRVKVDEAATSIQGYLTFMTCDDNSCLPPADIDFDIDLDSE